MRRYVAAGARCIVAKTKVGDTAVGKAERYSDRERLQVAVLAYCREDWKKRTGRDWSDEHTDLLRAELDRDLRAISDAQLGLVRAFRDARRVTESYAADDPRVAPLREFLATLSAKTVTWLGHFSDTASAEVEQQVGYVVDATPPDGRTRLVLFEMTSGRGDDPGLLARLSLLLGYFPKEVRYPMTVAAVVDLERKAMVQAVKRARKWLKDRRFEPVRR
jgi:hypothetical protein